MNDRKLFDRIRALIKSYTGAADSNFGSQYATVVRDGVRAGSLASEDAALLGDLRRTLEGWYGETPESPSDPMADWLRLYGAAGARLPMPLLDMLLSKVPAKAAKSAKSVDHEALVLRRGDRRLLTLLLARKILKAVDVTRIAKAHPVDFYRSPALDLLLEQRACPPRSVWAPLAEGEERPPGLTPGAEALVDAFANDRATDGPAWLVGYLAAHPALRPRALVQILRDSAALEKLVRHLGVAAAGPKGKRKEQVWEQVDAVVRDLLEFCVQAVEEDRRTARGARWAIGMLLLSAHAEGAPFASGTVQEIEHSSAHLALPAMLSLLRAADEGVGGAAVPIVVTGGDLVAAVQAYMQHLPMGAGDDAAAPERAARFQRFAGRKEVIQELLPLLSRDEPAVSRQALDAALFNVGLRPLGVSEGEDTFDAHRHQPAVPGILPREAVRIVQPGWQIGDDDTAIVLEKARVKPQP